MSRRERSLCTSEQWFEAKKRVEAGEPKKAIVKSLGMKPLCGRD